MGRNQCAVEKQSSEVIACIILVQSSAHSVRRSCYAVGLHPSMAVRSSDGKDRALRHCQGMSESCRFNYFRF